MARQSRESILKRLREKIANKVPIIGGGAGTGISAKCEEAAGIDLIVIYNSGVIAWRPRFIVRTLAIRQC